MVVQPVSANFSTAAPNAADATAANDDVHAAGAPATHASGQTGTVTHSPMNEQSRPGSPFSQRMPSLPASPPPPSSEGSGTSASIAVVQLKDGTVFQGYSFGAETGSISGECVFQTGMVGYPESLTDPSYAGQILVLTYPLIGNYGVPSPDQDDLLCRGLPLHFESAKIHVAGLIVGQYDSHYSHHLAKSSLSDWLKREGVPAVYGVDTRALTKQIRNGGVLLGKILLPKENPVCDLPPGTPWTAMYMDISWCDPNERNLVAEVSTQQPVIYRPDPKKAVLCANGKPLRVLAVDVGMKYNQIRCFISRGVELKVVPWDYDFVVDKDYDGLFISNGPGDPTMIPETIKHLAAALKEARTPIFGICLGHQLMALAAGAKTVKMKYGNRGMNIPCTNTLDGRCYITSQNHGYAVDASTLPPEWIELFVNANDGSNEGILHARQPFFSVQFHPESAPGPTDTEFLFDNFINTIRDFHASNGSVGVAGLPVPGQREDLAETIAKMKETRMVYAKKVLVLGSGGLCIGQAGEFDYSGSQAIKALKQEGIYTVLINPNIATIQTSKSLADKVYFLPVSPDFVRQVIKVEQPDGIFVTFGGQTALSVGIAMKDEFESLGVRVLGTPIDTIVTTEDRELFAESLRQIGEKCAPSKSATSVDEAIAAGKAIGYPVIIRAAYALGGLGSGFAQNEAELVDLCNRAFAASPQVLVERSMKGWKEIEYEVVRDCMDNCITVCNMENFDPLGIHTGDSIVVAPSQTLSNADYNMLRTTAVNVIRHLGVVGECNIQYALNPDSNEYCIIEVNARLSRSSALASKATGYPLAYVAAKLGLGMALNDIKNNVTKETTACFEPSLDYVVVKIPRWDLKKFSRVSSKVGSSMKSVGEVMSIGRTFEETIQKAIRCVDYTFSGFSETEFVANIDEELVHPTDQRLFAICNAMHRGYSVERIWEMTKIDRWFLNKLRNIVEMDKRLAQCTAVAKVDWPMLRAAKQLGFSDKQIANLTGSNELAVRKLRIDAGITPFVKQIDTVAAEFPAYTNYLYMTYNATENDIDFHDHGIMVLGSGVYRIGSSVEFDWCAVGAIRTFREQGLRTVMVNYNPETVSTDYDEADRLYLENITLERVLDIYEMEQSSGVVVSMGGQTPNNMALALHRLDVKIMGTSPEMIDTAENRYKFSRMLDKIGVDQPLWKELTSIDEAHEFCASTGYPVLVRPSYVLSGAAMNVVFSPADLSSYLDQAAAVSSEYPVVISKFIEEAKEIEMDAVAKNGKLIMHVVTEHVENAGVHSGDATLVLPPQDLDPETVRKVVSATQKIAVALDVTGPFNIQFIAKNNDIKVIECNLRAARSMPFVSKVTGVDLIEMAAKAMIGVPVEPYPHVDLPAEYVAVKVPQFSFTRLAGADPISGVEMASTGEVACFGRNKYEAYLKALLSTGFVLPEKRILLSIGSYKEKAEILPYVEKLHLLGYSLFATAGTADFIEGHHIPVQYLEAIESDSQKSEYSLVQHVANNLIDLYINLPSKNRFRRPASYMSKGYKTRRMAVDFSIPLITNVKCAKLFVEALSRNCNLSVCDLDAKCNGRTVSSRRQSIVVQLASSVSAFTSTVTDALRHVAPTSPNRAPSAEESTESIKEIFEDMGAATVLVEKIVQALQHRPRGDMQLISGLPSAAASIVSSSPFYRKHILSVSQFNRHDLHILFGVAQEMRTQVERYGCVNILQGRVLCTMFFEPSTRTCSSFEAAMIRLGGQIVSVNSVTSSVAKGESLGDTVMTLGCYGDAIVLRHPEAGSAQVAAQVAKVPIINAGDGIGEHPTQAFLDVFTIREELGTVNGLHITLVGDLKNGRTVHSLVKLLCHYNLTIHYVSPPSLRMPESIRDFARRAGIKQTESENLNDVIGVTDVLYVTRVQKERFADQLEYERLKNAYVINNSVLRHAKEKNMIIMHPLPRVGEIDPEVDFDQRAAYFRQMRYGLYVRMALLAMVLGKSSPV